MGAQYLAEIQFDALVSVKKTTTFLARDEAHAKELANEYQRRIADKIREAVPGIIVVPHVPA